VAKRNVDESTIPSYEQAREAAGLPEVVDLEEIEGRPITVLEWAPATRRLPETGKETEGFEMIFEDSEDGATKMCFVGAIVLVKELKALVPPFRTTIVKQNRTYKFS
jgi:hypothetical protein